MKETRSCREFIDRYGNSIVNCGNCKHWNPIQRRCGEEEKVVAAHEREFDKWDQEMKSNKGVYLG